MCGKMMLNRIRLNNHSKCDEDWTHNFQTLEKEYSIPFIDLDILQAIPPDTHSFDSPHNLAIS